MTREIQVVAGILWRDGRFLAVERPRHKVHGGFWEFPGGKAEPGESLEEALGRELCEELGVRPLSVDFWREKRHVYPEYAVRLFFFHVRAFSGEPAAREGQTMAWIEPGRDGGRPFLPADAEILAALNEQGG